MSELFNQAVAAHSAGRIDEAMDLYAKVLQQQPQHAQALELLGVAHAQTGDSERGLALLDQALSLTPKNPALLNNRGNMLRAVGRFDEAVASFDLAISLAPHYAEALNNRANTLLDLQRTDEAITDYEHAIRLQPEYTEAIYNLGVALQAANRPEDAVQQFEEALRLSPRTHQIHGRLAISLLKLNRDIEALQQVDMALALAPDDPHHLLIKGNILNAQAHYAQALEIYDQALQHKPDDTDALNSSAIALMRSGHYDAAVDRCERALSINPRSAAAFANRATAKILSNDLIGAAADIQSSLDIDSDNADAWVARGALQAARNDHSGAVESYKQAVKIDPYSADPYYCIGLSFIYLRLNDKALPFLQRAYELNSNLDFLLGNMIQCKMAICSWDGLSEIINEAIEKLRLGGRPSYPFQLMMISDDAELLRHCTTLANKIYNQPALFDHPPRREDVHSRKIRIGYVSADYHTHPVSQLLIRIIELHDRSRFEILAFSIDPLPSDDMRERLKSAFDEFIDIHDVSNQTGAQIIHDAQIDILVDLTGLTQNCRPEIFNAKPAPIQVGYLGYPCTTGSPTMDYIIGDEITTPFTLSAAYSEHIAQLPQCYLPYNSLQPISSSPMRREDYQLPESVFVFCCFNSNQKINPASFEAWCKVLMSVDNSVLWLKSDEEHMKQLLIDEARKLGVPADRLIFAGKTPSHAEHLARYRLADLFLDTSPYNAHTTASDALWAGLPVVTCMGKSFSSRVAGSILSTLGMPELVTENWKDFVRLAVEIATTPGRCQQLKTQLAEKRVKSALYNSERYTLNLERLFLEMHRRRVSGEPSAAFRLQNDGTVQAAELA